MAYFLGIDVGTSSVKVVLLDEKGHIHGLVRESYSILCVKNGYAEQHPDTWWKALKEASRQLKLQMPDIQEKICAIGFSGQMHGTVLLDKNYEVIRPAIIHCDARAGSQVEEIKEILGETVKQELMNPIAAGIMLPTLLWIKEQEPRTFEKIKFAMLPKDYLRYKLTGEIATDYSDASATLAFDLKRKKWASDILNRLGIPMEIFPECGESTEISGSVSKKAASELGLREGIPVVLGGGDQAMQSIGSGAIVPGQATSNIGSGGQICIQTDCPRENLALGLNTFEGYGKDTWYVMGAATHSGSSLRWLNQILDQDDYEKMNREVETIRPGCDGLVFLPYLSGERCPRLNADISGVFWGLSYLTDKPRLTRAVMEGVTFSLRSCLDACLATGVKITDMTAIGGGSQSRPWLQMQADIFDIALKTTVHREQAVFGAAIVAAVGTGHYPDVKTACEKMIRYREEIIEPCRENHELYEKYYGIYNRVYECGQTVLEEITRLGRG